MSMDSIKVLASKWAQRFKSLKVDLKEVQLSVSTLEFKEMKEVVPDMPDSSPFITDTHVPGTLGAEKPSDNLVWFAFSCYQLFTHHHKFFGALAAFNTFICRSQKMLSLMKDCWLYSGSPSCL